MSRRILFLMLATIVGSAASASAQWYEAGHSYEPGHSYFEPLIEMNEPPPLNDGFYFNYERMYWAYHSERVTVGSPNAKRRHVELWGRGAPVPASAQALIAAGVLNAPLSINPIGLPEVDNGLGEVFPKTRFDMGNRFIAGAVKDGEGWEVSFINPFEITQDHAYGYGYTGQDEAVPPQAGGGFTVPDSGTIPVDPTDPAVILPPEQKANPFGSVMVLFDYDAGFMHGFLDVRDGAIVAGIPGDVLEDDTNGDGLLDGDGFADDVNLNGVYGPDGVSLATAFLPDAETPPGLIDFGDLVELPTSFHSVVLRSILKTTSLQLTRIKRIQAVRALTGVDFLYGIRYAEFDDGFYVSGEGGVLGSSYWNTRIKNQLFGPQLGCRWAKNAGRWGFQLDGRALMAVNFQNWEQDAAIGEDSVPSQHNHPLYFSPTVSHHAKRKYDFSPMGELRFTTKYRLAKGVSLNLGYNGMFVDGIRRASTHIKYRLPSMGFVDGKRENIFVTGANFGVSFVH